MSDMIDRDAAMELRDALADIIGAAPMSSIHSALCEYADALAALPAVQIGIKPLEWIKHPTAKIWWAITDYGDYRVFDEAETSWCFDGTRDRRDHRSETANSPNEAKAAAQTMHNTRIRSALTLTPAQIRADAQFTLSDGQRLLRKVDILSVCATPDLCFEHDDGVARCGPCASKLAERDGITLNQYTVSNPEAMRLRRELTESNARADRAEAALAAQIEADAVIADDYVKMRERQIADEKAKAAHYVDVPQLMRWGAGKIQSENIAAAIRAHPHDRTALAQMIEAARAKSLMDAGSVAYRVCAETRHVTLGQKAEAAILSLIKPEQK